MSKNSNIKILMISLIISVVILSGCTTKDMDQSVSGDILTYSDILKTYPKDVKNWQGSVGTIREGQISVTKKGMDDIDYRNEYMCTTDAYVEDTNSDCCWLISAGNIQIFDFKLMVKCYGTKIRINNTVEIDNKTYYAGDKLTVDKDIRWIKVSSWD